ncbi:hypothetical protein C1X64_03560 [Pseudomonas sp. GW456-E7]|nr:hypothetical protein C1X64_03560 [Pseudomonas sp. GW456-E7]
MPPLDCEAVLKTAAAFYRLKQVRQSATASQPNGAVRRSDKPPRHSKLAPAKGRVHLYRSCNCANQSIKARV